MPTVHREDGFRIVIWTNDHSPPHVHCFCTAGEVVVELGSLEVRERRGVGVREINRAVVVVLANEEMLLKEWRKIHG
ncbi:MAG TPA: DUF4160 domain-containing protein [Longimicrobium sp.]|jgi:hypothetical protein|nr:DUF4160 domain-containing protein [Longimicrobium sp.]